MIPRKATSRHPACIIVMQANKHTKKGSLLSLKSVFLNIWFFKIPDST